MKTINQNNQDLIIIGGGIMGLMTAYFASNFADNITILEKRVIGKDNKEAASFSYTRSIRSDYPDPLYTRFANEAQGLWRELQVKSNKKFYIDCGCINLSKSSVTPDINETYAGKSYKTRTELNLATQMLTKSELKKRFPQFEVDYGSLEKTGGFLLLQVVLESLLKLLKQKKVTIKENINIRSIKEEKENVIIKTQNQTFISKKVVVTAGLKTNDLISLIEGNNLTFPLTPDRPQENKYFYPPDDIFEMFLPEKLPVFAYLDVGIYGHPIFDKKKKALKIGYYNPPDFDWKQDKISSVNDFINTCLPVLKNVPSEDVNDVDQCSYDLVDDDNFIIGKLPKYNNIIIGTGWRGTGFKFAPLVGKILSQLALQDGTVYDIEQFKTERFVK
ncbi:MAG TPA: FAD-dependent oxidoreductase [Candidatus Saccharimonadales bacterium]|nr:FAD-dependent oxidoreductase [Candidatus Saccharimonadales bacterium]